MMQHRKALPEPLRNEAQISGVPTYARVHGYLSSEGREFERLMERGDIFKGDLARGDLADKPVNFLAISGGGANGAFGAGLLKGWTDSGKRPVFNMVTGVSTGALTAPFAFLGSDYDDVLQKVFTSYRTRDLLRRKSIAGILMSDSLYDTRGLYRIMRSHMTPAVVKAIAREQRMGRRLWICTTDLDAMKPVYWSIGEIAASNHPEARDLICKIMLASASLPGMFPPVKFKVEARGETYDELHVDGGVTSQVYCYPLIISPRETLPLMGFTHDEVRLYVIRNSRLEPEWQPIRHSIAQIFSRSITSLVRNQGLGDLYRIYLSTLRDDIDFNLAFIPHHFQDKQREQFDPVYMKALFETGHTMATSKKPWADFPPGYETLKIEVRKFK